MNNVAMNIQNVSALWCALINLNVACVPSVPALTFPELSCGYYSHLLNMASFGEPQTGYCQHRLRGPVLLHPGFHAGVPQIQSSKHFFSYLRWTLTSSG